MADWLTVNLVTHLATESTGVWKPLLNAVVTTVILVSIHPALTDFQSLRRVFYDFTDNVVLRQAEADAEIRGRVGVTSTWWRCVKVFRDSLEESRAWRPLRVIYPCWGPFAFAASWTG